MSDARGFAKVSESRVDQADRPEPSRGLYGISVAAELVDSAPQNLRLYETRGLVKPSRSEGGTRRYSDEDLVRLRQIGELLEKGLNLAGVAAVLALESDNRALRVELDDARQQVSNGERG
jgi:MerR family transcriptional regulator/heat shock protein HspR